MRNKLKLFVVALGAGVIAGHCTAADAPSGASPAASPSLAIKPSDLFGDKVVAKGKGFEIKQSQLEDTLGSIKATYAARGQPIPPEHLQMLQQQVLEQLARIRLLLTKATDADKADGKKTCEQRIDEIKKRAGGEEGMNRQLKAVGTTLDDLRTKMTEESTAEAVLERELKVQVTDAEVKKFYDENPAPFEQPEMVRASHILFMTQDPQTHQELSDSQKAAKRKLAEQVLKRARAGEDFAKLAKEYSEDPGSKDNGGEYKFPRGQMVKEFEEAAFALKTNEISDIVTTQFGYHIIKLSEHIPAKKEQLAEVSTKIKDYLKSQAVQKQLPEYIAKLKKEADFQILDPDLKPQTSDAPVAPTGHANPHPADVPSGK